MNDAAIAAVRAAVAADPGNGALRLALAEMLLGAGQVGAAITEAATVLAADPGNARALELVTGAAAHPAATPARVEPSAGPGAPSSTEQAAAAATEGHAPSAAPADPVQANPAEATPAQSLYAPPPEQAGSGAAPTGTEPPQTPEQSTPAADAHPEFDWHEAESQLGDLTPPPFLEHRPGAEAEEGVAPMEPRLERVTFADVGGLDIVKARLNESFIQPMRHAAIAQAFKKSLRGGLLLYGPPGCGKTFMGRAVAGELEADFMSVSITDVVDGIHGQTEKNIHAVFQEARGNQNPTVLFLDEIDALALRRSSMTGGSAWLRSTVNQLLLEMDSMSGNNDGLYILAATNHPWDLDEAVLRPGRLDRAVLVSPPDDAARGAILRRQLQSRPVAGVDLGTLVEGTKDFSGADLQHLVVTASEKAMMDSIAAGEVRPISMQHLAESMREVRPSTAEWLSSARNVVRFASDGGRYDDLRDYLASHDGDQKRERRKGWWS